MKTKANTGLHVDDLLDRWEDLQAQGNGISVAELCRDCPHLISEVRRQINDLEWMDDFLGTKRPSQVPAAPAEIPQTLGRYELLSLIGQGGFGQVWKAYDPQIDRIVAVKLLKPTLHHSSGQVDRFLDEARKAGKLSHPNIVPVFDVGRDGQHCYIVSDFLDGSDMSKRWRGRAMPYSDVIKVVAKIAKALHHAHQNGVIHRDIKPQNILMDSQGEPFVTDFGIAVTEDELRQGQAYIAGTPAYMSPEQASGIHLSVDHRTDVYSLGVVLFELLVGALPYEADTLAILRRSIQFASLESPCNFNLAIPRELGEVCLKALERDPTRRWANADEFANALLALNTPPPPPQPAEPRLSGSSTLLTVRRRRQRAARRIVLIGMLGCIAALLLVALLNREAISDALSGSRDSEPVRTDGSGEGRASDDDKTQQPDGNSEALANGSGEDNDDNDEVVGNNETETVDSSNSEPIESTQVQPENSAPKNSPPTVTAESVRALSFTSVDGLEIADTKGLVSLDQTFTVELWIRVAPEVDHSRRIVGDFQYKGEAGEYAGWSISAHRAADYDLLQFVRATEFRATPGAITMGASPLRLLQRLDGSWHHLAIANQEIDGSWFHSIFLDGRRLIQNTTRKSYPGKTNLWIGKARGGVAPGFTGDVRAVRISSTARYDSDFGPNLAFELDEHTLALLQFDGSDENKVADLSDQGRNGRIFGAQWSDPERPLKAVEGSAPAIAATRRKDEPDDDVPKAPKRTVAKSVATFSTGIGEISSCSFSPDMKHVIASTINTPVFVWRLADKKELHRIDHDSRVVWATDKQVMTVGRLSDIRTWNISTGKSVKKTPFAGCYYRGGVSSNGKLVAYTDKTIGAAIYDVSRRRNVWRHPSNRDTVYSIDISSDGSLVAFGGRQGWARIYTVKGNKLLAEFRHGNYVQGVALSTDKKRLVTSSWDSKVRWFDLQAKKLIREHSASAPMSAAVSPDGSRYAAGGNGVVLVWDAKSGKQLARFSAHGGTIVTALSFSKDGEMLVSGGRDRNVSVWEIE